jgi:hypothetical protein
MTELIEKYDEIIRKCQAKMVETGGIFVIAAMLFLWNTSDDSWIGYILQFVCFLFMVINVANFVNAWESYQECKSDIAEIEEASKEIS